MIPPFQKMNQSFSFKVVNFLVIISFYAFLTTSVVNGCMLVVLHNWALFLLEAYLVSLSILFYWLRREIKQRNLLAVAVWTAFPTFWLIQGILSVRVMLDTLKNTEVEDYGTHAAALISVWSLHMGLTIYWLYCSLRVIQECRETVAEDQETVPIALY